MAGDMLNPFFAHLWSLSVEEQFYIFWPFSLLIVPKLRLPWFCLGVMAFSLAFRLIAHGRINPNYIYILTPSRMDALAVGALMSLSVRQLRLRRIAQLVKWPTAITAAVIWIVTLGTQFETTLGYTAASLFFAAIVFWTATAAPKFLEARWLRTLGKYSYGIYIFHVLPRDIVFYWAQRSFPAPVYKAVFLVGTVGVTFLLALLSWKLLESPFLRLKDRYKAVNV